MNKIKVVNSNLKIVKLSDYFNIECYQSKSFFNISDIKIVIRKSEDLTLELELNNETKLNISIELLEGVNSNIDIIAKGFNGKIQYKYVLNKNSNLSVTKFQNVKFIKEMVIVELNGEYSNINYNFKTISNDKETYDYNIFHNAKNTTSNIKNNGVCVNSGIIIYQVSSYVPKNITGCVVSQNNRIINLTNNMSKILPNLYIDCNDTSASHSALIGKFREDEMFYIQSRGINYKDALKLLITGFLTSDILNKRIIRIINKNIENYWG
ncbi:MAG: SufD family Fe-S cluster assembly protein [bacterium]|nr:SufD family Fe-S cluster assembly protein [bacterium]